MLYVRYDGDIQSYNQSQCYFMTGDLPPVTSSWRQAF
jgi:hypothetical protein